MGEGLRYADEIEQSYCRHVMAATSAHVAWAAGRWDEAIAIAEIELVERGSRRGTLGSRDALGFVAFGRGEVDRARALLEDSLAIGRTERRGRARAAAAVGPGGDVAGRGRAASSPSSSARTRLRRSHGDTGERALPGAVRRHGRARVPRGQPAPRRRRALARHDVREHLEVRGRLGRRPPSTTRTGSSAWRPARPCRPARASRRRSPAGTRSRRVWEATSARLDLATCLLRANRHAEAVPVLNDVRAAAERLGSAPLAAPVRTSCSGSRGAGARSTSRGGRSPSASSRSPASSPWA